MKGITETLENWIIWDDDKNQYRLKEGAPEEVKKEFEEWRKPIPYLAPWPENAKKE